MILELHDRDQMVGCRCQLLEDGNVRRRRKFGRNVNKDVLVSLFLCLLHVLAFISFQCLCFLFDR